MSIDLQDTEFPLPFCDGCDRAEGYGVITTDDGDELAGVETMLDLTAYPIVELRSDVVERAA